MCSIQVSKFSNFRLVVLGSQSHLKLMHTFVTLQVITMNAVADSDYIPSELTYTDTL